MKDQLYKVLNEDGTSFHGGHGKWPLPTGDQPGKWLKVKGELVPCQNGLHLCSLEQLPEWIGPALFDAEYEGERIACADKSVVRKARLLRRVKNWNDRTLRLWACDCAERALTHDPTPDQRSIDAIRIARGFANGEATAEQLAAAWDAAWAAARDAAWDAAWDAARDAAWDAARAAERGWQLARLRQYLSGEAE